MLNYDELQGAHADFDSFAYVSQAAVQDCTHKYVEYLEYRPVDIICKTLDNTTQLATTTLRFPMWQHIKARFPWLNCNQLWETVATDTYFANTHALRGATCAQVFYGIHSHMINIYRMKLESKMPEAYKDFIHDEGIPRILQCDNSQIQKGVCMTKINWEHFLKDQFMEPDHPQ